MIKYIIKVIELVIRRLIIKDRLNIKELRHNMRVLNIIGHGGINE